jgi:nitrite reductase/ring-hydroxylating ferredoxin subunit
VPPADAAPLRRLLDRSRGGEFVDTESDEGRDLVRALAARSPFIENSENLPSLCAVAFQKPRRDGAGFVSGILVATPDGARAYRNVCPHVPIPLDRGGEPLLTEEGFLACRNHGALFAVEDGFCVAGPCAGESLESVAIEPRGGGWALARVQP